MKKAMEGAKRKRAAISTDRVFRMAIISSRGQVTIPQDVRDMMHARRGMVVGFEPTRKGVLMVTMKVEPRDPYTDKEWEKIDKLSKGKGKAYHTAEKAKRHVANL